LLFYQLQGNDFRIIGRLLGFNHEPKAFGRNTGFALILLVLAYFAGFNERKKLRVPIHIGIIGIALTFSVSTYIVCAISISYLIYLPTKKANFKYSLTLSF